MGANAADDPLLRYPITGIAGCCARGRGRQAGFNKARPGGQGFRIRSSNMQRM